MAISSTISVALPKEVENDIWLFRSRLPELAISKSGPSEKRDRAVAAVVLSGL